MTTIQRLPVPAVYPTDRRGEHGRPDDPVLVTSVTDMPLVGEATSGSAGYDRAGA